MKFTAGRMTATTRRRIGTLPRRPGLPACTTSECVARLGRDRPRGAPISHQASSIRAVTADVESARRDWEDGYARFREEARDPAREDGLLVELEAVTDALRKRLGSTFTIRELAAEYREADAWTRAAVAERAVARTWPATLSIVESAAFHLYSRGALDYEP